MQRNNQGRFNRWSHRYRAWCCECCGCEQTIPVFPSSHRPLPRFPRSLYRHIHRYFYFQLLRTWAEANFVTLQLSSLRTEHPPHIISSTPPRKSRPSSANANVKHFSSPTSLSLNAPKYGLRKTDTRFFSASGSPQWLARGILSTETHI